MNAKKIIEGLGSGNILDRVASAEVILGRPLAKEEGFGFVLPDKDKIRSILLSTDTTSIKHDRLRMIVAEEQG